MNNVISACGLLCDECRYFNKNCEGCHAVRGATFWAKDIMADKICPLYQCSVVEKKYNNCGQCPELPCNKFNDLKDPQITVEEHEKSIGERVARLR